MPDRHSSPLIAPSPEQLDDWRMAVTTDLAEVKTLLKTLVGNGKPGTIGLMETRIAALETAKNRLAGAIAVISAVGGWCAHAFVGKH